MAERYLMLEAADEIERLRTANEELQMTLEATQEALNFNCS